PPHPEAHHGGADPPRPGLPGRSPGPGRPHRPLPLLARQAAGRLPVRKKSGSSPGTVATRRPAPAARVKESPRKGIVGRRVAQGGPEGDRPTWGSGVALITAANGRPGCFRLETNRP